LDQTDENPLADSQREKSGSSTYEKYEYQYHWALCRLLKAQEKGGEYALFMEFHEDVTLADSLNADTATFELNQVKNISGTALNSNSMTKIAKDEKSSILGKMLSHYNQLVYKDKIQSLNLVATCGFDLALNQEGLSLQIIRQENLDSGSLASITSKVKSELGLEQLPVCLQFVVPDLAAQNFQDATIGRLAKFLEAHFPGRKSNPVIIYRTIMDDLRIKGENRFDYFKWSEVLEGKAVTSSSVSAIVHAYTSTGLGDELKQNVIGILSELDVGFPLRLQVSSRCNDLYIEYLGNPTTNLASELTKIQSEIVKKTKEGKQMSTVIDECKQLSSAIDDTTRLAVCVQTYRQPQEAVQFTHLNSIAACQIFIDGDNVDAFAR